MVVDGLSRGVALFFQGAADQLAGIPHVIRLGIARGAASVVAEADSFEELRKFPRFGLGQRDGDFDGVHDRLLVCCGPGDPSAARSRVKGGVSQQTVNAYELGHRRMGISALPRLARLLGVSIEELIGEPAKPGKRGPAPLLQQKIERLARLPKAKQKIVMEMLDGVLAQASR
jgi:helix-turn-helix protein